MMIIIIHLVLLYPCVYSMHECGKAYEKYENSMGGVTGDIEDKIATLCFWATLNTLVTVFYQFYRLLNYL